MITLHFGSDHRGYEQKLCLINWATANGYNPVDHGTYNNESCDYPDFALKVAQAVVTEQKSIGIVICSNGIGVSIAANKVKGIRAALVYNRAVASQCRRHNNANIIALGADEFTYDENLKFLQVFLKSEFEGDRHQRRISKISDYEQSI